jgi:hypothetical protein
MVVTLYSTCTLLNSCISGARKHSGRSVQYTASIFPFVPLTSLSFHVPFATIHRPNVSPFPPEPTKRAFATQSLDFSSSQRSRTDPQTCNQPHYLHGLYGLVPFEAECARAIQ